MTLWNGRNLLYLGARIQRIRRIGVPLTLVISKSFYGYFWIFFFFCISDNDISRMLLLPQKQTYSNEISSWPIPVKHYINFYCEVHMKDSLWRPHRSWFRLLKILNLENVMLKASITKLSDRRAKNMKIWASEDNRWVDKKYCGLVYVKVILESFSVIFFRTHDIFEILYLLQLLDFNPVLLKTSRISRPMSLLIIFEENESVWPKDWWTVTSRTLWGGVLDPSPYHA